MLSNNIRLYGTKNISDLIDIVLGNDYLDKTINNESFNKENLIL